VVVDKELLQLPHQKERSHLYNCKTLDPSSKHTYAFLDQVQRTARNGGIDRPLLVWDQLERTVPAPALALYIDLTSVPFSPVDP